MKAHPGAAFFFPASPVYLRNPSVHYPFRQDSNFQYLTGFDEPESFLVLAPNKAGVSGYRMVLFVQPRDPEMELWEGERYGIEGAQKVFGADEAYSIHDLDKRLPGLLDGCEKLYFRVGRNPDQDRRVVAALEAHRASQGRTGRALLPLEDSNQAISELRLFKTPDEVELMRKACRISALAHQTAMKETRPGMNEREVEALIDFVFRREGCDRVGYGSIVAGGKNATCLHYRYNNEVLKEGDLLLIDAGGEYSYYTADITRAFPVGRSFTPAQAKAYKLVLDAQKEAISCVRPGTTLVEIHLRACEVLTEGMLSLGLLQGNSKEIIRNKEYRRFYPHNTSHWLGMDVHDVGLYYKNDEPRVLEPGMVLTVEPGFYVQPSDHKAPAEFHTIGIRIEDDVLVTSDGHDILSKDAPKEIAEIEALRF